VNKPHEAGFVEPALSAPPAGSALASASGVGAPQPHESAHLHVAGEATYVDDMPELAGTLHAALGLSPVAHGTLTALALDTIRALPRVPLPPDLPARPLRVRVPVVFQMR